MLALARAQMSGAKLLLLDEPTLGLAPAAVAELFQRLASLAAKARQSCSANSARLLPCGSPPRRRAEPRPHRASGVGGRPAGRSIPRGPDGRRIGGNFPLPWETLTWLSFTHFFPNCHYPLGGVYPGKTSDYALRFWRSRTARDWSILRTEVALRLLAGIERCILPECVERLGGKPQRPAIADRADRARAGQAVDHRRDGGVPSLPPPRPHRRSCGRPPNRSRCGART